MLKHIAFYIGLLFCCLMLNSCLSEDNLQPAGGNLRILLTEEVEGYTRSLPAMSAEMTGQFLITLHNTDQNKQVFNNTLSAFNTESRLLATGNYLLRAAYGKNEILALDEPYYISEVTAVKIEGGKEQMLTLPCFVGNALAAFEFTNQDKLSRVLKDYYIEVKAGNTAVRWNPGDTTNPYFKAGSEVLFYLKGTWIENNQPYSKKFATIQPAVARKLYRYRLAIDTSNMAGAVFDIQVDTSVETVTVNETVPQDWLPKPGIVTTGFDESGLLAYTETAGATTAIIAFTAARPVQDVEFELNFADQNLSSLSKKYLLSELSEADRIALQTARITLPVLDGVTTTGNLDLSAMTPQLLTADGGQEVLNNVKVRVKANNRWSEETTCTIKTVKPIFRVGVYPGNIWTKEFTMNPLLEEGVETGDYSKIQQNVIYEFSTDNSNWSQVSSDFKKNELTPGETYYIRAKYRGTIPGEVTAVRTYEAMPIPNCDLNDGYETTNPKKNNPLYTFKGGWIETRNSLTCHSSGANTFYVSKSGTLPVSENGSTAAYMMTLGWGSGNTCSFGNKSGSKINNISAGMVCVGSYNPNGDVIQAKAAYIRPTSMTFTYKASPYNGDEYLVEAYLENITDGKETIIGTAYLKSGVTEASYRTQTLSFDYDDTVKELPISHVKIVFKAGTKEDIDHLEDKFRKQGSGSFYSNYYIIGSQFWLDSFILNYDK